MISARSVIIKLAVAFGLAVMATTSDASVRNRTFPDDFLFGSATAAYQVEGGWKADGKGENIWDHLTHSSRSFTKDKSNGDMAADTYHNYKRDVEMMRELGLDAYRFSLSWARILPEGFSNKVNKAGLRFYNNYINEMLKHNIVPMVTIYHWDLPQKLQELGGFMNPLIAEWFEDYARVVYENFGDRVKHWITFNEPREICYEGYGAATKAPSLKATAVGTYLCAKNLLIAHARAYHLYNNEFKAQQKGECGITISVNWFGAYTDSEADKFATEIRRQAEWGLYSEPIFGEGGFPKNFADIVANKSAAEGYRRSRMPTFSDEEKNFVLGTADFFGVNHYSGGLVAASATKRVNTPNMYTDIGGRWIIPKEWQKSASFWLTMAPNSLLNVLTLLKEKYNNPKFYITENGWSTPPGRGLIDDDRIRYYRAALENVLDALDAGVNLKGYMAWSLMDNFEWKQGYTERFGLYDVDFQSRKRTRTPRKSAFVYKQIVKTRSIDHSYVPTSMVMTIDEGH